MKIGTHQDGINLPGLLLVVGNDAAHEVGIRVSKQIQQNQLIIFKKLKIM
jgi:hypothetical protein